MYNAKEISTSDLLNLHVLANAFHYTPVSEYECMIHFMIDYSPVCHNLLEKKTVHHRISPILLDSMPYSFTKFDSEFGLELIARHFLSSQACF